MYKIIRKEKAHLKKGMANRIDLSIVISIITCFFVVVVVIVVAFLFFVLSPFFQQRISIFFAQFFSLPFFPFCFSFFVQFSVASVAA